ncbi:MAG: WhiB family transcriptional regulator [Pseudonocardia sp.]|uniref:WhiB family transcriptional regulator n=1 Tax=Pseudonocardia sp. TaxID=60912 RepID=UPI001AD057A2|nr:WhiB family transcriptional regulator [Pseudonocardia sp.]MBN9096680.1 WhiB family transcriptional regulator [Pseudonocardia sp.]
MSFTRQEPAIDDWRHRAGCREEDPELFFPIGVSGPARAQIEEVMTVCSRCPVSGSCLNWALSAGEDVGVWGGLDEEQRRALRVGAVRSRRPNVPRVPAPGRRS